MTLRPATPARDLAVVSISDVLAQDNAFAHIEASLQKIAPYVNADRWSRLLRDCEVGGIERILQSALQLLIDDGSIPSTNFNAYADFRHGFPLQAG